MKNVYIILAFIFCVKIGASQTQKDLDSLVTKFVNEFQAKAKYQVIKNFNTLADSCELLLRTKGITFYKPATYHAEGYQPDEYFIDITHWSDKTSSAVILFYDRPDFEFMQFSCFFVDGKVKDVIILEIPDGSIYHYRYFIHMTGGLQRSKIWSEKYTTNSDGYIKESEEKIKWSDFVDRFNDLKN